MCFVCVLIHFRIKGEVGVVSCLSLLDNIVSYLQSCGHLLKKGLTSVCVMFPCDFVTFHYGVSGKTWCSIVSIPDLCRLL